MADIYTKPLPAISSLLEHFDFDVERGFIFYKGCRSRAAWRGDRRNGYLKLNLSLHHGVTKKQSFMVSRIIWKIATGCDPRGVIDHINGIRDDNRLANLRDVSPLINAQNVHGDLWARTLEQRKKDAARLRKERKEKRRTNAMQRALDHIPMGLGT